jgi:hypothetical protein
MLIDGCTPTRTATLRAQPFADADQLVFEPRRITRLEAPAPAPSGRSGASISVTCPRGVRRPSAQERDDARGARRDASSCASRDLAQAVARRRHRSEFG